MKHLSFEHRNYVTYNNVPFEILTIGHYNIYNSVCRCYFIS